MIIQTSRFGQLEIEDNEIIQFPQGIPGFPEYKPYTLISVEDSPFYFLQSVEEGSLSFVLVSPFEFFPSYEFELSADALHELGHPAREDVRVLNIVTVKDDIEEATVNLAAPIVWSGATRAGIQVILQDASYRTKHLLFQSKAGAEEEETPC
ncbi:flagellar assembly protein FliW [Paenibacillus sacheonensis]|uniref:Flagellar assembly factor FliW n=1 Tax=Paenibacillus sacheonensis TaxID=742054 RepID=A0A7X4YV37_9BACL|nr:flagellar assembly protein FliW [Paenibacillus sacheonensis]MBM7566477.1 flagellar assembly factor FliW [Paenibacillus sacheonensis]NBC73160.1 flagellar assembly protein FliW [Paenibacillus sacheonensis]